MNVSDNDNSRKYLVITAHPDDAELGCGGSTARWVRNGDQVNYIVCTNGNKGTKDYDMTPHRLAEIREKEQEAAAKVLGVNRVVFLRHQDGELEATMALRKELALLIRSFRPDVIVTHDPWRHYLGHPDHRAVGMSAMDAVVSARDHLFLPEQMAVGIGPHPPQEILFTFPDEPDFYVDISDTLELKMEAIAQHKSQVEISPHWAHRVKEWAEEHGKKNDCKYAEPFKRVKFRA
jgi:LmbE family N-acetylglucosaminyl deacetylase